MKRILVVDDEIGARTLIGIMLDRGGFEVLKASDATQALSILEQDTPDLIILDVMMPGMDGVALCRQLRADTRYVDLLVLFLTAKNTTDDVVAGLDAGGDDYVMKPFELAELTARVRALLRRGQRDEGRNAVLEMGPLRLDSDSYQVEVEKQSIQLTATEHRLLRYLMEHSNQALSPQRLLEAVWDYPPRTGDPDLVRAHVRNLRAKLERGKDSQPIIRTIHGVGYMIAL